MCDLTKAEQQYLIKTRSLTRDEDGQDILVGLTNAESELLMAYRRGFRSGKRDPHPEDLTIWLELAQKHELARPPLPLPLTESHPEIPHDRPRVTSRSEGPLQIQRAVADQV